MLDVKRNRLDYGELLLPPDGFKLTHAVATTYSVDLDTLLSIPVALYYAQTLEGNLLDKDLQLIRAIRETAKLLTIYHQVGQVAVPLKVRNIYAYLEESLVGILPDDPFSSFHPKTWLLRFQAKDDPGEICHRFIVLSRNLTFDRSWDVAASFDGRQDTKPLKRNQPLVDFYGWLHQQRPFKEGRVDLDEVARANFEAPESFEELMFHPIGIPGYTTNVIRSKQSQRLLCISPFLHHKTLESIANKVTERPELLSRRDELTRLPPDIVGRFDCYCLSDTVVDGERRENAEEGFDVPRQQDLHAKVYLFDVKEQTNWFLGSANATEAAFERNVEFMVELVGRKSATRLRQVRKSLLENDALGAMFEKFEPTEAGKETEADRLRRNEIRKLEYAILRAPISGRLEIAEQANHFDFQGSIDLASVATKSRFSVKVRPLITGLQYQALRFHEVNHLRFNSISEISLTQFLHFAIDDGTAEVSSFLLKIEIANLPSTRLDSIFKSIINSRDKFFDYLRLLLTNEFLKVSQQTRAKTTGGSSSESSDFEMPIFEHLLVTASRDPKRLLEVDKMIRSLCDQASGTEVVPNNFLSLWRVFMAAMPLAKVNDE